MLELAKRFSKKKLDIGIDFVAFCLEEPPFYNTKQMGSFIYTESLKEYKGEFLGAIVFEMIGYFSDNQILPDEFEYLNLTKGDFIAIVGNTKSKEFLLKFDIFYNVNLSIYSLISDSNLAKLSDNKCFWN